MERLKLMEDEMSCIAQIRFTSPLQSPPFLYNLILNERRGKPLSLGETTKEPKQMKLKKSLIVSGKKNSSKQKKNAKSNTYHLKTSALRNHHGTDNSHFNTIHFYLQRLHSHCCFQVTAHLQPCPWPARWATSVTTAQLN